MANEETKARWTADAAAQLVGHRIKTVKYLSEEECAQMGWTRSALTIELDNGHSFWPSADNEGNDAGALFTTFEDLPTIPVI